MAGDCWIVQIRSMNSNELLVAQQGWSVLGYCLSLPLCPGLIWPWCTQTHGGILIKHYFLPRPFVRGELLPFPQAWVLDWSPCQHAPQDNCS